MEDSKYCPMEPYLLAALLSPLISQKEMDTIVRVACQLSSQSDDS